VIVIAFLRTVLLHLYLLVFYEYKWVLYLKWKFVSAPLDICHFPFVGTFMFFSQF
jgi:hypothetical protein